MIQDMGKRLWLAAVSVVYTTIPSEIKGQTILLFCTIEPRVLGLFTFTRNYIFLYSFIFATYNVTQYIVK